MGNKNNPTVYNYGTETQPLDQNNQTITPTVYNNTTTPNTLKQTTTATNEIDANKTDDMGNSQLHWGVWNKNVKAEGIKNLLSKGFDPNLKNKSLIAPLHITCLNDFIEIDKMVVLLDNGANVNLKSNSEFPFFGGSPLHLVCDNHHTNLDVLRLLLDKGADPNLQDSNGNTPLHLCCENDRESFAEFLLTKNVKVDLRNKAGKTPGEIAKSKKQNCSRLFVK
eukprot:TRINITY_DN3890_c0_g1_i1.p2 TRINITY_DN3890_c0_g1~~TRINITY_DN3890_c0_g1_i1.p2  ORF type:complete len:223 (-),score=55.31 TRINITY_DN3890_c0_g1_i1:95-763(-)